MLTIAVTGFLFLIAIMIILLCNKESKVEEELLEV